MTTQYIVEEILRRDIADLEKELQRQKERAEKAEAELKAAREQEPVAWVDADGDYYAGRYYPNAWPTAVPLYTRPIPAPAVPDDVLLCDTCGADCENNPWHYSKGDIRHLHACDKCYAVIRDAADKPAVPSGWNIRRDGDVLIVKHPDIGGCSVQKEPDWERMIPEAILYSLADALLQSAGGDSFANSGGGK